MLDRVPVQKTVDGRTAWYLDDEIWASTGGNTIQTGHEKILGSHVVQPFSDIDTSAWAVKERLELCDEMGIHGQILYPNGVGFASNHVFSIEDVAQRRMVLEVYNDFYVDIQDEGNGRLFPQAMLPIWDMDFTVAEMTRLLDKGITGFTLVRQARDGRAPRVVGALLRTDVGLVQRVGRGRQLPHRRRHESRRDGDHPRCPVQAGRASGVRWDPRTSLARSRTDRRRGGASSTISDAWQSTPPRCT